MECWVLVGQMLDHPFPGRSVGGGCNGWASQREPFSLLNLDALPWGVAQHHVEAPRPAGLWVLGVLTLGGNSEDAGKSEMGMQEPVLLGQSLDISVKLGVAT